MDTYINGFRSTWRVNHILLTDCVAILTELQDLQITAEQLISQCYDGASVISGNLGTVQAKIKVYIQVN